MALPAFDRLAAEAFVATNAVPPSTQLTVVSMSAMTTSRMVEGAARAGRSDVALRFEGSDAVAAWSRDPNVFSRARQVGIDSALVGWYIPYCRILGHVLASCDWFPRAASRARRPFDPDLMAYQLMTAMYSLPFGMRLVPAIQLATLHRCAHVGLHRRILVRARELATDRRFGLVLVHWPVPHGPFIYNRFREHVTADDDGTYLDNLVLADRSLAEIRRAMESPGTWVDTHILVSSDHSWRVKLGGGRALIRGRRSS